MKVEKIKKLANNQYKIVLEDGREITTYDEVILKHNLLFCKDFNQEIEKRIEEEQSYYAHYNAAMQYLKKCMRSKKEIHTFLKKREAKEEEILKIIESLEQKGILNDTVFCSSFVSDQFYLGGKGPLKIRRELEEHAIDASVITSSLEKIKEEEVYAALMKKMQQKIKANHKYARNTLKQKLLLHFNEKGYEREMIETIFNELYKENPNILQKEYEKIKRQYARKYEGKELEYKVVSKLYQKGFLKEEIDKIKEEMF